MSNSPQEEPQPPRSTRLVQRLFVASFVVLLGVMVFYRIPVEAAVRHEAEKARTLKLLTSLKDATDAFYAKYHTYPTGGRATFVRVLRGEDPAQNPHNIVFFKPRDHEVDRDGHVVDAWGTPIDIKYHDHGRPEFISAGRDRYFDYGGDLAQSATKP